METEVYPTYEQREAMKEQAWPIVGDPARPIFTRAAAALRVIEAHYWRARESLEARPKSFQRRVHGKRYSREYLLDLDVYIRHWLHANGERLLSQEVRAGILKEFGYAPEKSRFLAAGKSMYHEPGLQR